MNKDIVPDLLKAIEESFTTKSKESQILKEKLQKLKKDLANHEDSSIFAKEIGNILAEAFKDNLAGGALPDGKMYYNIAQRLISPKLKDNYDIINDYGKQVQTSLNKKAGLNIKAVDAGYKEDKVRGTIEYVSNIDKFEDGQDIFYSSIENFSMSVVDDLVKANADLHYKAGLSPKIIRKSNGYCCDWCSKLVGEYDYEEVKDTGNNVFRRHRHCDCSVIYDPGNGAKRQDVHSKKILEEDKNRTVEERKILSQAEEQSQISRIAREKAIEQGLDPLKDDEVVNVLRKETEEWIKKLSGEEIKAIKKYTYNGKDSDGLRLFEKINGALEGFYIPADEKEKEVIIRNIYNINKGLLKNSLKHDIIVYRNDYNPKSLEGTVEKFLSTSVTKKGTLGRKPNVAIIVPEGSAGSYIENIAENKFKKQREFLINRDSKFKKIYSNGNMYILILDKERNL